MRFKKYIGIEWTELELAGLIEDEDSQVFYEPAKKHIALHPFHLNNLDIAVNEILSSNLNYYDPELEGFLIAYKNTKLSSPFGGTLHDTCYIHIDIYADFYIFRPKFECTLKGIVNKKGLGHIGVLVHKAFNVSIPSSGNDNDWPGTNVQHGQEVKFTISYLDFTSRLPVFRGILKPEDYTQGCRLPDNDDAFETDASTSCHRRNKLSKINLKLGIDSTCNSENDTDSGQDSKNLVVKLSKKHKSIDHTSETSNVSKKVQGIKSNGVSSGIDASPTKKIKKRKKFHSISESDQDETYEIPYKKSKRTLRKINNVKSESWSGDMSESDLERRNKLKIAVGKHADPPIDEKTDLQEYKELKSKKKLSRKTQPLDESSCSVSTDQIFVKPIENEDKIRSKLKKRKQTESLGDSLDEHSIKIKSEKSSSLVQNDAHFDTINAFEFENIKIKVEKNTSPTEDTNNGDSDGTKVCSPKKSKKKQHSSQHDEVDEKIIHNSSIESTPSSENNFELNSTKIKSEQSSNDDSDASNRKKRKKTKKEKLLNEEITELEESKNSKSNNLTIKQEKETLGDYSKSKIFDYLQSNDLNEYSLDGKLTDEESCSHISPSKKRTKSLHKSHMKSEPMSNVKGKTEQSTSLVVS